jgi:phosphoserine phosphatase
MQKEKIDIIYSSSSPRAYQTAQLIRGDRDIDILQSDAFKEINLGDGKGKPKKLLKKRTRYNLNFFCISPADSKYRAAKHLQMFSSGHWQN